MVEAHFTGPVKIESPDWAEGVSVPTAEANDVAIAQREVELKRIADHHMLLSDEGSRLLGFKVLLNRYGKSVLEPVVRRAPSQIGFKVLEPAEYDGEWDVDFVDEETGVTAVGEVEGSEWAINIDKLRQLLHYVEAEENEGRNRKGALTGNGFR